MYTIVTIANTKTSTTVAQLKDVDQPVCLCGLLCSSTKMYSIQSLFDQEPFPEEAKSIGFCLNERSSQCNLQVTYKMIIHILYIYIYIYIITVCAVFKNHSHKLLSSKYSNPKKLRCCLYPITVNCTIFVNYIDASGLVAPAWLDRWFVPGSMLHTHNEHKILCLYFWCFCKTRKFG